MSQFHWHAVDAQSFPLTIPGFPELSQQGAYSDQEVYSSNDVLDIVSYAGAVRRPLSYKKSNIHASNTTLFKRGIDVLMVNSYFYQFWRVYLKYARKLTLLDTLQVYRRRTQNILLVSLPPTSLHLVNFGLLPMLLQASQPLFCPQLRKHCHQHYSVPVEMS
jgi:hypothetical protein